ncbi:MAG: bifunctional diaminohydroxyphosphoribosylaminopyrimidine deaminase/5-amino-6-(5-phosphoribosylamino)uracil reductase RibD [candidate division WOR-3 bacterium]|nr:bifunctional diaminohydroxyphosphoribosylaminopyrimidine deaminase/5-amino-6-(5-phosphoribosylamino)uracil reductase RibD [candidate division WOR-3 bacterium]
MTDEYYMRLAIELAERGRGFVSPNPLVGAVIVKNRRIIGRGYHKKFGEAHAEINALENCFESANGATLYVTLEPCNFLEKKTPPCVPEIIKSGIKRVVIGTLDCNPKTCQKGVTALKKAGIETKIGVLAKEIKRQNESYFKYMQTGLPFVILKLGLTLDGRIATRSGESKWIPSKPSRTFAQQLRRQVDAILVGVNTVLKDNPKLTCRIDRQKKLTRVILDTNLKTPLNANVLKGTNPTIIFTKQLPKTKYHKYLARHKNLEIIPVRTEQNGYLAWREILKELAKRNIASLLIEGGAKVASSAFTNRIIDKVYLIYAPKIIGNGISFSDYFSLNLKSALRLVDCQIIPSGEDFIFQGYLDK